VSDWGVEDMALVIEGRLRARARRSAAAGSLLAMEVAQAGLLIATTLADAGIVLTAGNGGSATQCEHLVSEVVGRFRSDRPGMRAIALTAGSATTTAIGNDYGFDQVFSHQVRALGRPGDLVVLFTTSGNSVNLLEAAHAARSVEMNILGIVAGDGGRLGQECDNLIRVGAGSTAAIQEDHLTVLHLLCEVVESELLGIALGPIEVDGVVTIDEAIDCRRGWAAQGVQVAWTNGCFDLLHQGHLATLKYARGSADALIVGLNTDSSVRRLKGDGRPIVPEAERAELLASLSSVDLVVMLDDDEPSSVLGRLRPDVCVKGADYMDRVVEMPETGMVERHGGRMVFAPLVEGVSTSERIGSTRTKG
jgi:rfaE bifunctional protein nucleotidyltransferase chain/domain